MSAQKEIEENSTSGSKLSDSESSDDESIEERIKKRTRRRKNEKMKLQSATLPKFDGSGISWISWKINEEKLYLKSVYVNGSNTHRL